MGTLVKNGINYTGAEGGSTTPTNLNGLTDVEISSPVDGQVMKYNTTSAQWENENNDLGGLSNVNISSPANDQVLKYNSSTGKWFNGAGGGGSSSESYSTSEQVIGTWINGETLYQRTFTGTLGSGAGSNVNLASFNYCGKVVCIEGSTRNNSLGAAAQIGYYVDSSNFMYVYTYNNYIVASWGSTVGGNTYNITLKYIH